LLADSKAKASVEHYQLDSEVFFMNLIKMRKLPKILAESDSCPRCGSFSFHSSADWAFCNRCSLVVVEE
jgi:ribosomal protein S27AE